MDRELARKRPASVVKVSALPVPQGRVSIQFASRARMDRKLGELWDTGRIESEWHIRPAGNGQGWVAEVTFRERPIVGHRAPIPWVKVYLLAMGGLLALGLGYALVQAIVVAVAAIVPFIVGGAFILAAIALFAGRKIINISQNVNVR